MSYKKSAKGYTYKSDSPFFGRFFIILLITLTILLVTVFAIGRAVAFGSSTELSLKFYDYLQNSVFSFATGFFFDDHVPSYEAYAPGVGDSSPDRIDVFFKGDDDILYFDVDEGTFKGKLVAVKDPTRFSIGRPTQEVNALNVILRVSDGELAFSSAASHRDRVLAENGECLIEEGKVETFIGFTNDGILHFGSADAEKMSSLGLSCATAQDINVLICGGAPFDFELSRAPIGKSTVSIAQCSDGSVLLLFLDEAASYRDAMEVLYRHGAVNAAVIHSGNNVGYVVSDGESFSYSDAISSAEFSSAWMVK